MIFNSRTLNKMKSGVKIKSSVSDCKTKPSPKNSRNIPVSIGLRVKA